jgi:hypothetical protein
MMRAAARCDAVAATKPVARVQNGWMRSAASRHCWQYRIHTRKLRPRIVPAGPSPRHSPSVLAATQRLTADAFCAPSGACYADPHELALAVIIVMRAAARCGDCGAPPFGDRRRTGHERARRRGRQARLRTWPAPESQRPRSALRRSETAARRSRRNEAGRSCAERLDAERRASRECWQ